MGSPLRYLIGVGLLAAVYLSYAFCAEPSGATTSPARMMAMDGLANQGAIRFEHSERFAASSERFVTASADGKTVYVWQWVNGMPEYVGQVSAEPFSPSIEGFRPNRDGDSPPWNSFARFIAKK